MGRKGAKNRCGMIVRGGKRETPKKARIPFCAFIVGSHRSAELREERNGVMIAGRFSARRLQEDRGGAAEFFHSRVQRRIDTGGKDCGASYSPSKRTGKRTIVTKSPRAIAPKEKLSLLRKPGPPSEYGDKKRRTLGWSVLPLSRRSP